MTFKHYLIDHSEPIFKDKINDYLTTTVIMFRYFHPQNYQNYGKLFLQL